MYQLGPLKKNPQLRDTYLPRHDRNPGRKQRNKDQRQKMPHKAIKRLKQQFIV